jgi:transcriptional regulator with XRE-family HTH domain
MTPSRGARALREWREGEGLSYNAAAKRFETDRDTYMKWESGASVPTLRYVARATDIAGVHWRSWLEGNR